MLEAVRAKTIITLAGEAPARTAAALDAPLLALDNAVLVIYRNRVLAVERYADFIRRSVTNVFLRDLGEVCITPGFVNAHCHLELSHLYGKTVSGKGFSAWVRSLVPLAEESVAKEALRAVIHAALRQLSDSGVAHTGDVGNRNPALVAACAFAENSPSYPLTHFLEAFGFGPPNPEAAFLLPQGLAAEGYAPSRTADMPPERYGNCAVSGHALYSTGPEALRAAHQQCRSRKSPFTLHLAESEDEDLCLRQGRGDLHALLSERVLPPGWRAPGLSPVRRAAELGLLDDGTLAVHCVHVDEGDMDMLARQSVSVCLCPRSNVFIGTGKAPAARMASKDILLCLGTDGLSSNHSLDMQEEMAAACDEYGLSPRAVLRMATLNGAAALGCGALGSLGPGKTAAFAVLSPAFARMAL